ncbi:ApbE family protein [Gammaproteobacteria bacterium 45_16_T64]|nr:ApbE family protein [Gammaproteobacteria bacterium 45_16_T64]
MATFILAAVVFGLVMAGMAVGVIFQDKPIKGSCGGLNNVGLGGSCDICGGDTTKCEEENAESSADAEPSAAVNLAYDATKK